jgi:hypothetical protein
VKTLEECRHPYGRDRPCKDIIKKHLEEMFNEIGRANLPENFSTDILVEPIVKKYISGRRSDRTPRFNKLTGRMTRR